MLNVLKVLEVLKVRSRPLSTSSTLSTLSTSAHVPTPVPISAAQFDRLVARLTREAETRPLWYKIRVFLFAMLGYAYIFGVLALILAIVGGIAVLAARGRAIILIKNIAIPLVIFAWVVGKALWVKLEPPTGKRLAREKAPRLFAAIDDICAKIDAPRADVVLLTDDYNAAVSQIPRLGVFGLHQNYLIVGLPLMQALPPNEWRGVLAHEFSHLSRAHARFSNWIYRVRKTWFQLMDTLEKERQGGGAWLFQWFFHWYAPYFGAYSFVLARRDEFEADALAARVVGPEAMARGFLMSSIRGRLLAETFWPQVHRQLITQPTPPEDLHSRMANLLRAPVEPTSARQWGLDTLAVETGSADTHPSARDRIAALGVDIERELQTAETAAAPIEETAAEHFLGPLAIEATKTFDVAWRENAFESWQQRHQHELREEARLTELEQRHTALDDADLWDLARLLDARRGADAAEPYLRHLLTRSPRHAAASYTLGYNLLARDDEAGIPYIETAMAVDPDAIPPGSRTIAAFLRRHGRIDEAVQYETRADEEETVQQAAAKERESVSRTDSMSAHEVDDAALDALRASLARFDRIKAAWLVRKVVTHRPDQPLYVLGVDLGPDRKSWLRAHGISVGEKERDPLIQALANTLPFPGEAFVVPLNAENAWLRKKMKKIYSVPFYERDAAARARKPAGESLFPRTGGDRARGGDQSSSSPPPR